MEIGVLAIQGDFAEHIAVLGKLGVTARDVRLPEHLDSLDGLIIPGGESTTLSRLMTIYNLREPIEEMAAQGRAIWGTCAGMIMLSREITEKDPIPLGVMDIGVQRNAFGRQVDSFEQFLDISSLGPDPFHAIFIRAPVIIRVGQGVEVLSAVMGIRTHVEVKRAATLSCQCRFCKRPDDLAVETDSDHGDGDSESNGCCPELETSLDACQRDVDVRQRPEQGNVDPN